MLQTKIDRHTTKFVMLQTKIVEHTTIFVFSLIIFIIPHNKNSKTILNFFFSKCTIWIRVSRSGNVDNVVNYYLLLILFLISQSILLYIDNYYICFHDFI